MRGVNSRTSANQTMKPMPMIVQPTVYRASRQATGKSVEQLAPPAATTARRPDARHAAIGEDVVAARWRRRAAARCACRPRRARRSAACASGDERRDQARHARSAPGRCRGSARTRTRDRVARPRRQRRVVAVVEHGAMPLPAAQAPWRRGEELEAIVADRRTDIRRSADATEQRGDDGARSPPLPRRSPRAARAAARSRPAGGCPDRRG